MRTILAIALATSMFMPACAVDSEEAEATELRPGDGKADGSTFVTLQLTEARPRARAFVACNEWIGCDLSLRLSSRVGTRLVVDSIMKQQTVEYVLESKLCGESERAVLTRVGSDASCDNVQADVFSPIPGESFDISVIAAAGANYDTAYTAVLSASWH